MKKLLILPVLFALVLSSSAQKPNYSVTQIATFNQVPHSAFTDLIQYNNTYYCCFRESSEHNSMDGRIRVLKSSDGNSWSSFAILSKNDTDLRDPHFFIDPKSILCVATNARQKNATRENLIYKLGKNGFQQSFAIKVDNDYWLWSYSKFRNSIYSIGYNMKQACFGKSTTEKPQILLFKNANTSCTAFRQVTNNSWLSDSFHCASESSILFKDNKAIAIVRDETPEHKSSFIGTSTYPFKQWQWQKFPYFVRGPKLAALPDGRIFLCAASMIDYQRLYFAILNPATFRVEKIAPIPSGGDCGYAGVIVQGDTALVSYYSSHEGNTHIYIDRVKY